jgi:hypothetical protein
MNLEDDLRRALRREPAPADFATRILSKTTLAKTRILPFRRRPVALAIAAALALAALIPPAVYQHRRQQRALEARDQLVAALAITRVQLEHVKERIRQTTRRKI